VNPSIRESVLVLGVLQGTGVQSPCVVRAVKVSIPRLDVFEYVKAEVAEAPANLPEGNYELFFEGRRMQVHRAFGDWRIKGF
jgi:hypothetical protein